MKKKILSIVSLLFVSCFISPIIADDCCPDCADMGCCEGRFFIDADWLYFKTQQENLSVGNFVNAQTESPVTITNARTLEPRFKYESGFRVNAGYQPPCSQWQFDINYTYLPFCSKTLFNQTAEITIPEIQQLIVPNTTLFPLLTVNQFFSSQLTKWHGNFSYVDVDFSRTMSFCDCFHLRPHIGFRALWMDQTLSVKGGLVFPSVNDSTFAAAKLNQKFQGYGIEGGFWSDFLIGYGFSFVGHFGGSILYSDFNIKLLNEGFLGEEGELVYHITGKDDFKSATPTVEYFVGLQYETNFSCASLKAHVGWEQRVLFNVNGLATVKGNFSVQGLNVGLSAAF